MALLRRVRCHRRPRASADALTERPAHPPHRRAACRISCIAAPVRIRARAGRRRMHAIAHHRAQPPVPWSSGLRLAPVCPHGARPSALLYAVAVASSRSSVPSSHIVDGFSTSHSTSASCGTRGKRYGMRWQSARAGRVRSTPHTLWTLRTGAPGRCSRSRHSSAAHGEAEARSIRGGTGLVRYHARLLFVGAIHHSPILRVAQCTRELTSTGAGTRRTATATPAWRGRTRTPRSTSTTRVKTEGGG